MKKPTFLVPLFLFLFSLAYGQAPAGLRLGAERTEIYLPLIQNKKVAVCGNHTSMVGNTHLVDTLLGSGISVVSIFCPEHGFRGEAEAGATIKSSVDAKTGLPIVSLYGNNKKPKPEQLKGIDIIVFDIQDVGCRFYTYISTLHYVMEAAAESKVEVMILDRPNPNGYFVDGPVLEPAYKSFIGMHRVPVVHGMTIAEYGKMINAERWLANKIQCKLHVIEMENYTHTMRYELPLPPSPNLKTKEAVYLYPSLCFFEGTCISIGRGTENPFEVFGNPELLIGDYYFTPQPIRGVSENPPQKGKKCRGFNLSVYAVKQYEESNKINLSWLISCYKNLPDKTKLFERPEFFDKLAGSSKLRNQIVNNVPEEEIYRSWQKELSDFKVIRKKYLLYPDFE